MLSSANPKLSFALYAVVAFIWIYDCIIDKLHPLSAKADHFTTHLIAAVFFTAVAIYKGFALRKRTEVL